MPVATRRQSGKLPPPLITAGPIEQDSDSELSYFGSDEEILDVSDEDDEDWGGGGRSTPRLSSGS